MIYLWHSPSPYWIRSRILRRTRITGKETSGVLMHLWVIYGGHHLSRTPKRSPCPSRGSNQRLFGLKCSNLPCCYKRRLVSQGSTNVWCTKPIPWDISLYEKGREKRNDLQEKIIKTAPPAPTADTLGPGPISLSKYAGRLGTESHWAPSPYPTTPKRAFYRFR